MKTLNKNFIAALLLFVCVTAYSQSYKETFDSNSLEWAECAYESSNGSAVIDGGFMMIKSKGVNKTASAILTGLSGVNTQVGENTFFETHCYAPIDVKKPFKIRTHVNIQKLALDRIAGFVFNYKDGGTFYCFQFNSEMVRFARYENNVLVGDIEQGVKWDNNKKTDQEWELISENDILTFLVDGMPILKVRYMPLSYSGVGYYTFGKQELIVDDIEFIQ